MLLLQVAEGKPFEDFCLQRVFMDAVVLKVACMR